MGAFLKILFLTICLLGCKAADQPNCLDRDGDALETSHINVFFDPNIRSVVNEIALNFNEKDIVTMIDVAATRFHKFFVPYFPPPLPRNRKAPTISSFRSIFRYMALYNFYNLDSHPLELEATIYADLNSNITDIISLASRANSIYSGTVKKVMFSFPEEEATISETITYLEIAKEVLRKEGLKFGLFLYLHQCDKYNELDTNGTIPSGYSPRIPIPELPDEITLPEATKQLLGLVDFVVFFPKLTLRIYNQFTEDMERSVDYLTKEFGVCEKAVTDLRKDLDVHLAFAMSSNGRVDVENTEDLVKYWKLLGNWAKGRGKDVFFQKAFDTPMTGFMDGRFSDSYQGWWRVVNPDSLEITRDGFVEKICDLRQQQIPLEVDENDFVTKDISGDSSSVKQSYGKGNESNCGWVVISVGVGLIFMIILGCLFSLRFWYLICTGRKPKSGFSWKPLKEEEA